MARPKPKSRATWKSKIKKQMIAVGTYNEAFDPAIDTLADILEQRDAALQEFIDSGGEACFEHVSDRGAVNIKKNPRLIVWQDLNTQALAYWRDMGLTPAGLKKLNDAALKAAKKGSPLEEALKGIGI
jgi:hypothetical protein